MAHVKLRKVTIPVILYNGINPGPPLEIYYTDELTANGLTGSFSNTAILRPDSTYSGYSLVGYKLIYSGQTIAYFKPGELLYQSCTGYNSGTNSSIVTTKSQYQDVNILFNITDLARFYAMGFGTMFFQAIYVKVPIKLNSTILSGVKEVIYNGNSVDVLRYNNAGTYVNLFSKSQVTIKYISKVNRFTDLILWTGSCNIETASGMSNVLMENYKLNKAALPLTLPYSNTVDTIFERAEPSEIREWKDLTCLPTSEARSYEFVIPQRSKFISSINVDEIFKAPTSETTTTALGIKHKLVEFDAVNLEETYGERKFPFRGGGSSASMIYHKFKIYFKNTTSFNSNSKLVWQFNLRDYSGSDGSFQIVAEDSSGNTIYTETIPSVNVSNNKRYYGTISVYGHSSIRFYVIPTADMGTQTYLSFIPFYVKLY